jgi:hypothetical protein
MKQTQRRQTVFIVPRQSASRQSGQRFGTSQIQIAPAADLETRLTGTVLDIARGVRGSTHPVRAAGCLNRVVVLGWTHYGNPAGMARAP